MPPKAAPRRQPPPRRNARATPAGNLPDAPAPKETLELDSNDAQDAATDAKALESRGRLPPEPMSPAPGSPTRPAGSRTGSATGSAAGRPVQRLDSLSRRSQSGSSPAPGAPGSKPVGLKFQPKFFIRRSKEEREAQARVEAEKLQARIAANAASSASSDRGGRGGRGGYSSRGRGGMGRQAERFGVGQASGVLGGVTRPEDGARKGRSGMGGPWSGTSRSSNFETTRVKNEPMVKSERDRDGDVSMGGFGGRRIKTEGGYVSSDSEPDAAAGPRVNIEHISLVSDEDSDGELETNKGKERAKSVSSPGWAMKPVRLDRHEHHERSVGVSTEASSKTSAELRKKAREKDEAEGSLFMDAEEEEPVTVKKEKNKGSTKSKDVEFVRNERKWKGVYQDSDGSDDDTPKVKKEPETEDAMLIDTPPAETTTTTEAIPTFPNPTPAPDPPPKHEPPTSSKPERPRKPLPSAPKPVLQTEEDRAEWARRSEDIQILADELGLSARTPLPLPLAPTANPNRVPRAPDTDFDGDTAIPEASTEGEPQTVTGAGEENAEEGKVSRDKKDGHVYLFQFPPLVPTLLDPALQPHAPSPSPGNNDVVETSARHDQLINPDPDAPFPFSSSTDDTKPDPSALDAATEVSTSARGGLLGWLVVHVDGECVVGWGGGAGSASGGKGEGKGEGEGEGKGEGEGEGKGEVLSMALGRGGEGELLQEVLVVDVGGGGPPGAGAGAGGDGDTGSGCGGRKEMAWGMGQLVGGFVVTPDWGRVFGGGVI